MSTHHCSAARGGQDFRLQGERTGAAWPLKHAKIALGCFFLIVLGTIYIPDAGHGFVKDDFVWIATSRILSVGDIPDLLVAKTGFFRPVVSASFAADFALFGFDASGYGLTNILLLFGCIGVIGFALRALGASTLVATAGSLAWGFNFHGINMAVLWLSGRTALWVSFWWTLASVGFVRRARLWPVLAAALAMLSKEEGLMLPTVLLVWAYLEAETHRLRYSISRTWLYWSTAVVILLLRFRSGAMTPWSAPAFYTYDLTWRRLCDNSLEYADRSLTLPVAVLVVFWLCVARPRLTSVHSRRIWQGVAWFILAFAPTLLLPSRSSLYVLLPSIGAIIALSSVADSWLVGAPRPRLRLAAFVFVGFSLALWPVYKARNVRYEQEARLAAAVLDYVSEIAHGSSGGLVVLQDVRDRRPTAEQAFGTLAAEASRLVTDGKITLWIDPPPRDLGPPESVHPPALPIVGEIRVENGFATQIR